MFTKFRLHFDLEHLEDLDPTKYTISCCGKSKDVFLCTEEDMELFSKENKALGVLTPDQRARFRHYTDVEVTNPDILHFVKVYYDTESNTNGLPFVVATAFVSAANNSTPTTSRLAPHGKLMMYGHDKDINEEVRQHAKNTITPWDSAVFIVKQHPQLAAQEVATSEVIDYYINEDPIGYGLMYEFASYISRLGKKGYCESVCEKDKDGNPITYKTDSFGHKAGEPVYHYMLKDDVLHNSKKVVNYIIQKTANDPKLKGKLWNVCQTHTVRQQQEQLSGRQNSFVAYHATDMHDSGGYKYTLQNPSTGHGITLDPSSMKFDGNSFSINLYNKHLRTMSAYVQFERQDGSVIKKDKSEVRFFETEDKWYLKTINAVDTVVAVPLPASATMLKFEWPKDAVTAKIIMGSLGCSEWDNPASWPGGVMTFIFQYAIPGLFLLAGALLESTKWYRIFTEDEDWAKFVFHAAQYYISGVGSNLPGGISTDSLLTSAANCIGGLLAEKGLVKLAEIIAQKVSTSQVVDNIPFVGWVARAASMAVDAANLAHTTANVLSSPASTVTTVVRTFDLEVTATPDPEHGTEDHSQPPIWPAVADHWICNIQYKCNQENTTPFQQKGSFPTTSSSDPIKINFKDLPAGGHIKVTFVCFSSNNWIAGQFVTEFLEVPLPQVSKCITENLVPLTPSTQYLFKEKLTYDGSTHKWTSGEGGIPTTLVDSLDTGNEGHNIGTLVGMTIDRDYNMGYAWCASEQGIPVDGRPDLYSGQQYTFQNISILADPEFKMKFVTHGYGSPSHLAYNQFDNEQAFAVVPNGTSSFCALKLNLSADGKTFVINTTDCYGVFNGVNSLDAVCVHPQGYLVATNREFHKLFVLRIPITPSHVDQAPYASVFAGKGNRQGLVSDPAALTVNAEGQIIVLEAQNKRFQSFTPTGHPSPRFLGKKLFSVDQISPNLLRDLKEEVVSSDIRKMFSAGGVKLTATWIVSDPQLGNYTIASRSDTSGPYDIYFCTELTFQLDPNKDWLPHLVTGAVSEDLQKAFASNGIQLSLQAQLNDTVSATVMCGEENKIILKDSEDSESYMITITEMSTLEVYEYNAFNSLHNTSAEIIYQDIVTDVKGFIFVLYHKNNGKSLDDYCLDIYDPFGCYYCTTPDTSKHSDAKGIAAGKIILDQWRSLFALNYDKFLGPNNRTEPRVSHFTPTTPDHPA